MSPIFISAWVILLIQIIQHAFSLSLLSALLPIFIVHGAVINFKFGQQIQQNLRLGHTYLILSRFSYHCQTVYSQPVQWGST